MGFIAFQMLLVEGIAGLQLKFVETCWSKGSDTCNTIHTGIGLGSPFRIRRLLLPRGGIPLAIRRRSRLALTLVEREDISRGALAVRYGTRTFVRDTANPSESLLKKREAIVN
jgi:hypothetical protein